MSSTYVRHPSSLSLQCTCGQEAHYTNTSQYADGVTDRIDVYMCPFGHVVQVAYPFVQQSPERRKPDTAPSFPGNSQSW